MWNFLSCASWVFAFLSRMLHTCTKRKKELWQFVQLCYGVVLLIQLDILNKVYLPADHASCNEKVGGLSWTQSILLPGQNHDGKASWCILHHRWINCRNQQPFLHFWVTILFQFLPIELLLCSHYHIKDYFSISVCPISFLAATFLFISDLIQ